MFERREKLILDVAVNLRAGRYADDIPLKKEIKEAQVAGSQYANLSAWTSGTSGTPLSHST